MYVLRKDVNIHVEKRILLATEEDKEDVLKLYKTMLFGPAEWDEHYPSKETIDFDVQRNSLFIMKNENDEIIATVSVDDDEAVEKLTCWSPGLKPVKELSRICVRKDMQGQGIAKKMLYHIFDVLKNSGVMGIHILVKTGNAPALSLYEALGFTTVGECFLYERDFICMEKVF